MSEMEKLYIGMGQLVQIIRQVGLVDVLSALTEAPGRTGEISRKVLDAPHGSTELLTGARVSDLMDRLAEPEPVVGDTVYRGTRPGTIALVSEDVIGIVWDSHPRNNVDGYKPDEVKLAHTLHGENVWSV
jgi:hypothetical protein